MNIDHFYPKMHTAAQISTKRPALTRETIVIKPNSPSSTATKKKKKKKKKKTHTLTQTNKQKTTNKQTNSDNNINNTKVRSKTGTCMSNRGVRLWKIH